MRVEWGKMHGGLEMGDIIIFVRKPGGKHFL
jgi:hypothetical protein